MGVTLEEVLKNAQEMSSEDYMKYCDTIEKILDSSVTFFEKSSLPHKFIHFEDRIYGYNKDFFVVYDFFALNRKLEIAWAQPISMLENWAFRAAIIPQDKIRVIREGLSTFT